MAEKKFIIKIQPSIAEVPEFLLTRTRDDALNLVKSQISKHVATETQYRIEVRDSEGVLQIAETYRPNN